jgi:predicted nucleic-acid-binding Zn-ribbon protein
MVKAMPNPLDPEAVRLVNRALEELRTRGVKNDRCPRCDTHDWNVEPVAIKVIPLEGPSANLPMSYFPEYITAIQIVCKNCGYTMFHNLRSLGLAPWNV